MHIHFHYEFLQVNVWGFGLGGVCWEMPPSQSSFDLALYLIIAPPGDNTVHPPQLIVFVDHCLAPNKEIVKQFQLNKDFEDQRKKVISARTYFYEDEHKCDVHLETFLKCIDAVGK